MAAGPPDAPVRIDTLGGFDVTVEGVTLPARIQLALLAIT